eukprot:347832-Chlamydomonas_euryale.AAC.2
MVALSTAHPAAPCMRQVQDQDIPRSMRSHATGQSADQTPMRHVQYHQQRRADEVQLARLGNGRVAGLAVPPWEQVDRGLASLHK